MLFTSLFDQGVGNDINWVVDHTKTSQQERLVVAIREATEDGVAVGTLLRSFLEVAPTSGRLFRRTEMKEGGYLTLS
jgi:hypothetical protein